MSYTAQTLFKPAPILEFPASIYRYLSPQYVRNRQVTLFQEAISHITATQTIPQECLSILKWYARIIEYILRIPELDSSLKASIALESPFAGFNAIVADYASETAQVIELSLLSKPEYVCKLLLWAYEKKVNLRYPFPIYYTVLFNDFYWSYYFYANRPIDHFYERMIKHHLNHQNASPNSVLCLACLEHIKDLTPYTDMLAQDCTVAYQTAILFGDKVPLDRLLFEASLEPQWAYHILVNVKNLPEDIEGMCQSTLDYNPPWLLEYLHQTKVIETNLDAAKDRLLHSFENSAHPFSDDMREGISFFQKP